MPDDKSLTPMMKQYLQVKAEAPKDAILMFRMGDFYEMFFNDAKIASPVLEIALTTRAGSPMCGVPYHAIDVYLPKLLEAGLKVAIAEQQEDPALAKGIVKRGITRVVTPGSVIDGPLLKPSDNNFLCSYFSVPSKKTYALAWLDISTGEFAAAEYSRVQDVVDDLSKLHPRECLAPASLLDQWRKEPAEKPETPQNLLWTELDDWIFSYDNAYALLNRHFGTVSLEGFGVRSETSAIRAAGAILAYTEDNLNLKNAEKVLNKDHYGLDDVKERILEHLAVLKLKSEMKAPIICLYGSPGVGKTSLGKSIAAALKRKYVRISLGGVHDEAEIRGHRKTYIGAMPGRIIKGLIKAGTSNPVFILDEIDKVGADWQGDPSSALLEVLDPEQNTAFHDNYLDVDYDLSRVLFIATANNLNAIPAPLLDRMELIEVSGYITEEKIEIARKHLIPKELEANGFKKNEVKFTKEAVEAIIESYTRESGVRELEKKIGKVLRKLARQYATDEVLTKREIKPADLYGFLGVPEYTRDKYQGNEYAGVVTGLAWTSVGGEILFVETSLSRGKGSHLTLTGNLGDVMKESAMLALEYIKAHAAYLDIDPGIFENWNIHIHVPEGAIPKDGPSAGITMVTSLASALTQRKVKPNLAMTGEITLRGKVLPVGGIKEKILAAKRAGIKEIIMSAENKKNIEEIKDIYLKGLTFHYVDDIKEVLSLALTDEKVANAIDLSTPQKDKE